MRVWIAPSKSTTFREGNARAYMTTLCRELCKNGLTDRDGVWVVDSGEPKEACVIWDTHWRHLANMIEPSMFGGLAKTAEPMEMPYWMWTLVGPRNHLLDGVPDSPMPSGNF